MAGPVADRAVAELHPSAPRTRQEGGAIGPLSGRTKPQVPVEQFGNLPFLPEVAQAVDARTHRPGAAMDRVYVADGAVADPLDKHSAALEGMALVAHLRDDLVPLSGLDHRAAFGDGVGQRLFAVHVLAMLHGRNGRDRMVMIRSANHHGVDVFVHLVEHLAEVAEPFGLGMVLECPRGIAPVHVAEGDDVVASGHGAARRRGPCPRCRCRPHSPARSAAGCRGRPAHGGARS